MLPAPIRRQPAARGEGSSSSNYEDMPDVFLGKRIARRAASSTPTTIALS
jgi:hypothetical protein